jgi:hypothetical protein
MVHVCSGVLFGNKEQWKYFTYRLMNGIGDHHVKKINQAQRDKY